MGQSEGERHKRKREPGESAEADPIEFIVDQKPQQKTSPENFLDERHNNNKSREAQHEFKPVKARLRERLRVKPAHARRESEERLRRNPQRKNANARGKREAETPRPREVVFASKANQQRAAENCLRRVNPELGMRQPQLVVDLPRGCIQHEQRDEDQHRHHVSG